MSRIIHGHAVGSADNNLPRPFNGCGQCRIAFGSGKNVAFTLTLCDQHARYHGLVEQAHGGPLPEDLPIVMDGATENCSFGQISHGAKAAGLVVATHKMASVEFPVYRPACPEHTTPASLVLLDLPHVAT